MEKQFNPFSLENKVKSINGTIPKSVIIKLTIYPALNPIKNGIVLKKPLK